MGILPKAVYNDNNKARNGETCDIDCKADCTLLLVLSDKWVPEEKFHF